MFNRILKLKISTGTQKDNLFEITEEIIINDLGAGNIDINGEQRTPLRVAFTIDNSARADSRGLNTAEISIYNLSVDTRNKIEKYGVLIEVTAGYANNNGIEHFDFMGAGAPDKDYGVRDFKAKFGGELVEHGRFVYICKPWLYKLGAVAVSFLKRKR